MKGKHIMGGMLGFTAVFAGSLWYFQNYAFYEVDTPDRFDMTLVSVVSGAPETIAASGFTVLDAETSPLKFRACFRVQNSIPMMTESYEIYDAATPLQPPAWFDCFDHVRITEDLASGEAVAFLSQKEIEDGVDRVVAVYDDGRAYAWHQLNDKYAEKTDKFEE